MLNKMNNTTDITKWMAQINKGYLELCMMVALNGHGDSYGAQLLDYLNRSGLNVNEGTLYPLLNRMHKNGWLSSRWQTPTDGGHPRRVYRLNKDRLPEMRAMTETYKNHYRIFQQLEKNHEQR